MIAIRLFSSAVAAVLSLVLGAATAHAYITPDEFIQGGGESAPESDVGDIGNVPLPNLGPPPQSSSPAAQIAQPKSPVKAPLRRGGAAPVAPLLDAGEVVPPAEWESREEERKALRGAHNAAPEMPHTAASSLAPSGLPLAVPLLISMLGVGGMMLLKKNTEKR